MSVTVSKIFDPLGEISQKEIVSFKEGLRLDECLKNIPLHDENINFIVGLNGKVFPLHFKDYHKIKVKDGDCIAVSANTEFSVAAAVAWAATSSLFIGGSALATIAYGLTFTATLFAMGALGAYLISALVPDIPSIGGGSDVNTEQTYTWGDLQQTYTEGTKIPISFGRNKMSGHVLNRFIRIINNKEYLYMLLGLADHQVDSIDNIKINGSPASYFRGTTVYTRLGTLNDELIPGFDEVVGQRDNGATLLYNVPVTQDTYGDQVEKLYVIITAPKGLYYSNDEGGINSRSATFNIEYKIEGGSWVLYGSFALSDATTEARRMSIPIPNLTPGKYTTRITRTNPEETSFRGNSEIILATVQEVVKQPFIFPGLAKYAVVLEATEQLSNGIPTITCETLRNTVSVYDEDNETLMSKRATNPSWLCWFVLHYYGNVPTSRLIWEDFAEWASYCDEDIDGELRFEVNKVFNNPTGNIWDDIQKIAKIGHAVIIPKGNKYGVFIDKPDENIYHMFGMSNIDRDSFNIQYLEEKNRANAIVLNYNDPDRDFTRQSLTVFSEKYELEGRTSQKATVDIDASVKQTLVVREGIYRINSNRYLLRVITFRALKDSFGCLVGDNFYFEHESLDYQNKSLSGFVVEAGNIDETHTEPYIILNRNVILEEGVSYAIMARIIVDEQEIFEERFVTNTVMGETNTLTLHIDWTSVPTEDALFFFGKSTTYKKKYRMTKVGRVDNMKKREITALEYIDQVYNNDSDYIIEEPEWEIHKQTAVNVRTNEFLTFSLDGGYVSNLNVSWHNGYIATGTTWSIWLEDITGITEWISDRLLGGDSGTFSGTGSLSGTLPTGWEYTANNTISGVVEPALYHNLVNQPSAFDDPSWIKDFLTVSANAAIAPDGTMTAEKLIPDTTVNQHRIKKGSLYTAEKTVNYSVYMKTGDETIVDNSALSINIGAWAWALNETEISFISNMTYEIFLDIDVVSGGIYPKAPNDIYSEYIDTSGKYNIRFTTGATPGNIFRLLAGGNGFVGSIKSCVVRVLNEYGTNAIILAWNPTDGVWLEVRVNLFTGEITGNAKGVGSISDVGNGWYRVSVSGTFTHTANNAYMVYPFEGTVAGDGVSGIYTWGAQITLGADLKEYVTDLDFPTSTSIPIDKEIQIEEGITYTLSIGSEQIELNNSAGTTDILTWTTPISPVPVANDPWSVTSSAIAVVAVRNTDGQINLEANCDGVFEYSEGEQTYNDYSYSLSFGVKNIVGSIDVGLRSTSGDSPIFTETITKDGLYNFSGEESTEGFKTPFFIFGAGSSATFEFVQVIQEKNEPTHIGDTFKNTFLISENLVIGKDYRIYVSVKGEGAVDTGGNTTSISILGKNAPPNNVTGFVGAWDVIKRQVHFTWTKSTEIDILGYSIVLGSTWNRANEVVFTQANFASIFIDEGVSDNITYLIKAIDTSGNESETESSTVITIDTSDCNLSVPGDLTLFTSSVISPDGTAVSILIATWNTVSENSDEFGSYQILLEDTVTGRQSIYSTTENVYQWTLIPNREYSVQIRAVDKTGNKTEYTAQVLETIAVDSIPPATPTWPASNFIIPGFKVVGLNWNDNTEYDLSHYIIERSIDNDFSVPANIIVLGTKDASFTSDDQGLEVNTTYYYRIKAVDTSGNESEYSSIKYTTTLQVGTTDIAVDAIIANHISSGAIKASHIDTTELFSMILQSQNYSPTITTSGSAPTGYKFDALNDTFDMAGMIYDPVNGLRILDPNGNAKIQLGNTVNGEYVELNNGEIIFYLWTGTQHVPYKSLRRYETGTTHDGETVELPGYFRTQPQVKVLPESAQSYSHTLATLYGVDQVQQFKAVNIVEFDPESTTTPKAALPGTGRWRFDVIAKLIASSAATWSDAVADGYAYISGAYYYWYNPYAAPVVASSTVVSPPNTTILFISCTGRVDNGGSFSGSKDDPSLYYGWTVGINCQVYIDFTAGPNAGQSFLLASGSNSAWGNVYASAVAYVANVVINVSIGTHTFRLRVVGQVNTGGGGSGHKWETFLQNANVSYTFTPSAQGAVGDVKYEAIEAPIV